MATTKQPSTDAADLVPLWLRIALVAGLAVPQLVTGIWALVDPSGWYADFPGVGPDLVRAIPPYNEHLATDAGAGFLATGLALVAAAWWGRRHGIWVALVAYLAFAVPHTVFHAANRAPGLSDTANALQVAALVSALGLAVVLAVGSRPRAVPD